MLRRRLRLLHLSHLEYDVDYPDAESLGLMEQMMVLKWVHENIEDFGNDADNVWDRMYFPTM